MSRFFNIAGANRPEKHYTLPALARLPDVHRLVGDEAWFALHAPRQSGKTTAMRALAAELTTSGRYAALWATCEAAQPFAGAPEKAERIIAHSMLSNAVDDLPEALRPPPLASEAPPGNILSDLLQRWCRTCPLPVVLLLDEIDALQDDALISVLRQLRGIFHIRPKAAPSAVALIGLRDVRDFKVASGKFGTLSGPSPFNVSSKALTLGNFTRQEVAELYGQHTAETGQAFAPEALELAYDYTRGQPWLVNALANEVVAEMQVQGTILPAHLTRAKERLVLRRAVHLDSLADKLNEPRVRAVMEPMLVGDELPLSVLNRDVDYCRDLGLVSDINGELQVANPIYREVLPRELGQPVQIRVRVPQRRWSTTDNKLDLPAVLQAFVDFWRQHGEWMVKGQVWQEAAHQIVLMAFLQRLVNGGAAIEREYGLGTRRLDLLVRWNVRVDQYGAALEEDLHALECKVWRDGKKDPLAEGLVQLDAYCARLGLDRGTLLVFDGRSDNAVPWEERGEFSAVTSPGGRAVTVLRV